MSNDANKLKNKLIEILGKDKGYFGRVYTWGMRPTKYEYIGYELSKDIYPSLAKLSEEHLKIIIKVVNYFDIHASSLKKLLKCDNDENSLLDFYSVVSWSHFMTVVMFGMLEIVAKTCDNAEINKYGSLKNKQKAIKKFFINNLPELKRLDIAQRYKTDKIFGYNKPIEKFSDVVDHLWSQIRSGFIHDAGLESKGLEWTILSGVGTKEKPMTFSSDVPMQELLQITWEAIFHYYGYDGCLVLPKYRPRIQ